MREPSGLWIGFGFFLKIRFLLLLQNCSASFVKSFHFYENKIKIHSGLGSRVRGNDRKCVALFYSKMKMIF